MPDRSPLEKLAPRLIAMVWLPFACAYFFSLFFRFINAIISPDLARDLGLNPSELGLITSAYLLSFALFQIPLGLLLDRFGPRRVNAALLLVAALGSVLFALSESFAVLVAARALIGLGVSGCLMNAIKAFLQWFPLSRLATLNGWLLAVGGLGAMTASTPIEIALRVTDWRGLFFAAGAGTAAVAALVFYVVPDKQVTEHETFGELVSGLKTVLASGLFWRMGLLFAAVQGGIMSVQGLWIVPWLRDVALYARPDIGQVLMWIAVASTAGFFLIGNITDRLSRRGVDPMAVLKYALGASIAMFALLAAGVTAFVLPVLLVYSFCGTATVLVYAILSREFPQQVAGRVNTATNMLVFLASFATQWGMGAVINLWPAAEGRYALAGYQTAFGIFLALQLATFAVLLARPAGKPSAAAPARDAESARNR